MTTSDVSSVPMWRLSDAAALERLRELVWVVRVAEAELLAGLASAESRGLHASYGYRSMNEMVGDVLHSSRHEAKERMRLARALQAPEFAATAAALREGVVSVGHLDKVSKFHASLSSNADFAQWAESEASVAEYAKSADPVKVKRVLDREVGPRIDPDGSLPSEKELAEPRNSLWFEWQRNGRLLFKGNLEGEMARVWTEQLSAFSYRHNDAHDVLDTRTPDQVRGDALAELIKFRLAGEKLPEVGGERPQLVVSIGWNDLKDGLGTAIMGSDNQPISASEARRLACDANVIPIVLGLDSKPLDIGHSVRTISPHIRRLVTDRDRGCTFPGCERPPTQSEIHHIIEWRHGGGHEPANLATLCNRHHRIIHHTGWEVRMASDHRPEFIPPSHVDPRRAPSTNRTPWN